MTEIQKINASSAINKPLALARQGSRKISQGVEKLQVTEKVNMVKEHSVVKKVLTKATEFANMLWAFFGFALLIHGAQFKNLFLCIQLIKAFYLDRVKTSVTTLAGSVTTALEKMKADEPQPESIEPDAKSEAKSDKYAAKRAAKKDVANPDPDKQSEEDVAVAKKALKAMDSEKFSNTAFEVCSAAMACHMVMHTHLGQAIVVAHGLANMVKEKIEALVVFADLEDLPAWTDLILRVFLYSVFFGLALVAAPFALAFDVSSFGAHMILQYGSRVAQSVGKLPDAESFVSSKKGLITLAGLTAFGTLWQFWSLMAASGMAWYFKLAYLPAIITETIVGCL
jgi:hypothetical protein